MSAGNYNISCEQGATLTLVFEWTDEVGTSINLTGFTAKMQARASLTSPTAALEASTANGMIVIDPLIGRITLTLEASATALLTSEKYVYDLEMYNATEVTRLLQGIINVDRGVTQ